MQPYGVFAALVPIIKIWVQGTSAALLITAVGLVALFAIIALSIWLTMRLRGLGARLLWNSAGWLAATALAGVLIVVVVFGLVGTALSSGLNRSPLGTAKPASITVRCSLSQRILRPGLTLQMTYHISSSSPVLAGLGAGLYDNQGNDHSNGRYDRNAAPLMAGAHTYTRLVVMPAHLPPGRYELDAEVWPPNHVGQNGFNTWTNATCAYMTVP